MKIISNRKKKEGVMLKHAFFSYLVSGFIQTQQDSKFLYKEKQTNKNKHLKYSFVGTHFKVCLIPTQNSDFILLISFHIS